VHIDRDYGAKIQEKEVEKELIELMDQRGKAYGRKPRNFTVKNQSLRAWS
jgi:hypothetical protein